MIVLRIRRPQLERPVKVLLYPLLPLVSLGCALAVMGALLLYRPAFTWPGLVIVLLGALPVYTATRKGQN